MKSYFLLTALLLILWRLIWITIPVPDVPQAKLIPSYSNNSQALKRLYVIMTMFQRDDNIGGSVTGSPTSFTVYISNPVSGRSFNSTIELHQNQYSYEETSSYLIELPNSSYCSQSTIINVVISADIPGEGPSSNFNFTSECTNNFVQVLYKESISESSFESTISCVFLDPSNTAEKTCCVTYQLCDQERIEKAPECIPQEIELKLFVNSSETYCYTVIASNETYTVKVEDNFTTGFNQEGSTNAFLYYVYGALTAIAIIIIFSILALLLYNNISRRKRHKQYQLLQMSQRYGGTATTRPEVHPQKVLKRYLIPYHLNSRTDLHEVPHDCNLQEFVTETVNVDYGFRRGHTYYEFTNEVENIQEGKKVLLQEITKSKTKKWFQLDWEKILADGRHTELYYGEGIARSRFGIQYKVFIQSFGSGARHLPNGSSILYDHHLDQVEPDVLPLVPICSQYFACKIIDSEEGCTIQQFCTQNRLSHKAFNMFLTVKHLPEEMRDQPARDVILMNRESGKLFTGPFARQMLDLKKGGESQHENEKWKVFVLLKKNKQGLVFKKNSEILYQDSRYRYGKYSVLEVEEDYHSVRMSKFIETKLDCQYEDGKAFYKAEKEEDLLYCKKILRPQKEQLSHEQVELQSPIQYFYAIDGVPAKEVKLEKLRHSKIFIQSTSQGSRCLRKGDKLLYLKEYIVSSDRDDPDDTHSDSVSA